MSEQEAAIMQLAAPLHDVGKIGIPDSVLNKPGKYEPEEWEVMKTHAEIGWQLLSKSNRKVIQLAAQMSEV